MRFLMWFARFFAPLPDDRVAPRPKFFSGTEWICPDCGTTLAIARHDIYRYDIDRSSDWDVKDFGFWKREHCGRIAFKYDGANRVQFLTPTGWVG